jgi:Leucine-rich repeat (LRR) protein
LNLSGNPINGYGGLAGLTNLGGLWLQGNVVGSPDFVSGLRRLSFLDCDQCQITNLSPLIALTNLQGLCLSSNAISAGVGLGNLSRLGYLDLSYNSLLNYTAIGALTNLTSLYLGGNGLTNLSFLSGMPQLRALGLEHNALSDLGTMAGLTNLGYLNVNYNRLTNITSLQGIKPGVTALVQYDLLDLNTGSAALSVIAAVQEAGGSITYLPQNQPPGIQIVTNWIVASGATTSLGFSVFDDATPSGQLLVTANFANTALFPPGSVVLAGSNGDRVLLVTPVAGQTGTNVITLTATDESGSATNVFVTVSVIAPVTVTVTDPNLDAALRQAIGKTTGELDNLDFLSLTTLIAPDAALTNLAGLQWAVNLTGLSLDVTGVTNLAPLQSLSHLSGLSLKNVFNAPDLSPLSALTNLTSLSLNGKAITNLAFLQPLTQLTYLTLNNSRATTMDPLAGLTNLVVLGLQVNLLTNVWAITNLTQLTSADLTLNLLDLTDGSPARTAIQIAQALGATVHYDPQRQAPVITIQPSYVVNDNASSLLFFTVRDNRPAGDLLWVAAGSGNEALLPNDTNHLVAAQLPTGDGGLDWAVVVNPLPYRTGNAQVTLAATNESGLSTSITFLITVVSSQSVDGSYFVGSNLQWSGGGSAPWFGQNIITHAGAPAAQSGSIGNGGESILEATALGPGTLTYWWKVSSEAGWDFLEFYLNEVLQPNRISGEVDWQQKVFSLPVGTNVVRWRYFKDPGCCSQGLDAAWLAQVNFTFKSWLELMQRTPNGQVQLLLHVQPGKLYELQTSTNLANWSSLKLVQTNSFTMAFTDTTATPASRFYRLMEFPILLDSPARLAGGAVQLRLHSPAGHRFELQATTNFTAWSTLGMVTNTLGTVSFTDTTATNLTRRFYRAALR